MLLDDATTYNHLGRRHRAPDQTPNLLTLDLSLPSVQRFIRKQTSTLYKLPVCGVLLLQHKWTKTEILPSYTYRKIKFPHYSHIIRVHTLLRTFHHRELPFSVLKCFLTLTKFLRK